MVHDLMTEFDLEHGLALIRALGSLTREDAETVERAVRDLAGAWSIEFHDDYEGYLSLLILPLLPAADNDAPGFLVSGRTGAVEVAELRGDGFQTLGCYASASEAAAALRRSCGQLGAPNRSRDAVRP